MNSILIVGMIVVNLALFFYTIGSVAVYRRRKVSAFVLWTLSLGLFFDAFATACMICGSSQGGITLHGLVGYSALMAMGADVSSLFKLKKNLGLETELPRKVFLYSMCAYAWWIIAYVTGALIVGMR